MNNVQGSELEGAWKHLRAQGCYKVVEGKRMRRGIIELLAKKTSQMYYAHTHTHEQICSGQDFFCSEPFIRR